MAAQAITLAEYYSSVMRFALPRHFMAVCDALDDERIKMLMIISGPGNGKSTVTSQAFPAKIIGERPSTTVLGISAAEGLMQGFMGAVQQTIEGNPRYRQLFPAVAPNKAVGWSTDRGLYVLGHDVGDPDPSFFGCGIASKSLTGKHGRIILLDDIHDEENSATPEACDRLVKTFFKTLFGRGDPRGARYILSGRRFHETDAYGQFMKSGDWVVMVLPAERPGEPLLYWDVCVPIIDGEPLKCVFTERLPAYKHAPPEWVDWKCWYTRAPYGVDPKGQGFFWPEMASKRFEYFSVKRNAPAEAEAVYQCNPKVRTAAPFRDDDFCYFDDVAWSDLKEGRFNAAVEAFLRAMGGFVVQSWDTSFGKTSDSAFSACVTALLYPSSQWWRDEDEEAMGPAEKHYRVYLLDLFHKRVQSSDLVREVRKQHAKWRPRRVLVEDKASGISILQTLKHSDIAVKGVKAQEGKLERALDAVGGGAGSAQGWFRQHRVPMPRKASWGKDVKDEFKGFVGTRAVGRKDIFDAVVHLVCYAIEAGSKAAKLPGMDAMRGDLSVIADPFDPRGQALAAIAGLGASNIIDPFAMLCGRCESWDGRAGAPFCRLHKQTVPAIGTCPDWRSELTDAEAEAEKDTIL